MTTIITREEQDKRLAEVEAFLNEAIASDAAAPPPEPIRVFEEPGRGVADAIHLQARVLCLGPDGQPDYSVRTVCGVEAPHRADGILVHDDGSCCQVCLTHRHDFGVDGRLSPVRNIAAPPPRLLPMAEWVEVVLPGPCAENDIYASQAGKRSSRRAKP